jgi:hypothetical protein
MLLDVRHHRETPKCCGVGVGWKNSAPVSRCHLWLEKKDSKKKLLRPLVDLDGKKLPKIPTGLSLGQAKEKLVERWPSNLIAR